jgi:hypothetical protein
MNWPAFFDMLSKSLLWIFSNPRFHLIQERKKLKQQLLNETDHVKEFDLCRKIQANICREAQLINKVKTTWPVEKMAGSGLVQSTLRPEDRRLARPLCRAQQLPRAGFCSHRHTGVSKISLAIRQIVILHRRSAFFLSCER